MNEYPADDAMVDGAVELVRRHVAALNIGNQEEFEGTSILSASVVLRKRPQEKLDKYWAAVRTACPIELTSIVFKRLSAERPPAPETPEFRYRAIDLSIEAVTSHGILSDQLCVWYVHPDRKFFMAERSLWRPSNYWERAESD